MIDGTGMMLSNLANSMGLFGQYLSQQNAVFRREPVDTKAIAAAAAYAIAEHGDQIIGRMYFWVGLGFPIAPFMLNKLADRLNTMTDEIERSLAA